MTRRVALLLAAMGAGTFLAVMGVIWLVHAWVVTVGG